MYSRTVFGQQKGGMEFRVDGLSYLKRCGSEFLEPEQGAETFVFVSSVRHQTPNSPEVTLKFKASASKITFKMLTSRNQKTSVFVDSV